MDRLRWGGAIGAGCNWARRLDADRRGNALIHFDSGGRGQTKTANHTIGAGNCPFIKFPPKELADSRLRKDLTVEDFTLVDSVIPAPTVPGLGISRNEDAVERFPGRMRANHRPTGAGAASTASTEPNRDPLKPRHA